MADGDPSELSMLLRQFAAGVGTIPSEALRGAAIIANPMRFGRQVFGRETEQDRDPYGGAAQVFQGAGDAWNRVVNRQVGVEDPSLLDDTGQALSRLLGGSILPISTRGVTPAAVQALPAAARMAVGIPAKALELLTPVTFTGARTIPGKAAAVAANVGVQAAAGTALEYGMEPFDPTVERAQYDADGNLVSLYTPADDNIPGAGRVAARAVTEAVGDHPVAASITGAGLVAAGALGYRQLRRARVQREAMEASDVSGPIDRASTDVPIIDETTVPGYVRGRANRFTEVAADANTLTKDAIDQATGRPSATPNAPRQPPPVTRQEAQAAKDAVDMVQEPAHKDRLVGVLEDGVLPTPRGTVRTESLTRIFEDLYHETVDKPDLNKATKELITLETELDNRAYARSAIARGDAKEVLIDIRTGDTPVAGTHPRYTAYVTPRATLWHISDQDLVRRVMDIGHNHPEATQYALRYWKYHSDLADAWVNFGLVSKAERAKWGRANPHFMHTINLDDAKSPRTFRIREHRGGPEKGGDPLLAATEYTDFMLGHVYRNRMRKQVVETLRAGGAIDPGAFGNGKWIGRVAHPAEVRRRQVIDPKTGQLRQMTKDDVTIEGDRISYYDEGEVVDVEIRNASLLNTLKTMPSAATTVLGAMRQLAQSGMTGKLATLVGQPFVLANATMGGLFASIVRKAGNSFGYLDAGMQALTRPLVGKVPGLKNPIGVRGDPTAIAGMLNSAMRDIASILTRGVRDAFYNSIAADGWLAKVPNAQAIADRAAKRFEESMYAKNHHIGSGSASTLGSSDFDSARNRASVVSVTTPHGNQARVISDPQDWKEVISLAGDRIVPADVKVAARILGEINDAIGNMAQTYHFRSNYGKVQKLDDAARVPEAAYAREMAQVDLHEATASGLRQQERTLRQQAAAAKAANNPAQARALTLQAQYTKSQATGAMAVANHHRQLAEPHRKAFEKASEAWFNEYMSLGVATRQLLGDPAQMGSALRDLNARGTSWTEKLLGRALDMTPYGNIGMQAGARLIKAMKENPGGTATALAMVVMPMAIVPIWNAVRLDREARARGEPERYVEYELSRPGWDSARFVMGSVGGLEPDQSPRMRVDPLIAPVLVLMREAYIEYMGLNRSPSDPMRAFSEEQLDRLVRDRIYTNVRTAALGALPFSQVAPVINAGAQVMGFEIPPFEQLIGRGSAQPIRPSGLGAIDDSRTAHALTSKTFDAVVGALGAGAATTIVGAVNQGWQSERRVPGTAVGAAWDEVTGRARDRLPELRPLWAEPAKRATTDYIGTLVNEREQTIRAVTAGRQATRGEGTIGSGRYRERDELGGGRQGAADPDMDTLLNVIPRFSVATAPLIAARQKERDQMTSLAQRGLSFAERRVAENAHAREITRINTELLAKYTEFEDRLSERFRYRIRLDRLDPSKPITQFRRMED
jgi:hypothetical protein